MTGTFYQTSEWHKRTNKEANAALGQRWRTERGRRRQIYLTALTTKGPVAKDERGPQDPVSTFDMSRSC